MNKPNSKNAAFPRPTKVDSQAASAIARQRSTQMMMSPEMASFRVITQREREEVMSLMGEEELLNVLRQQTQDVQRGDMKLAEAMLINQAVALQSLFVKLVERGLKINTLRQQETALRLALKAQSQSRATLETLSNIKNPPVVYAKQANVTTGPQQINNGQPLPTVSNTREQKTRKNKLKELDHGQTQRLDTGTQSPASGAHPRTKAMVELDRTTNRTRKGQGRT